MGLGFGPDYSKEIESGKGLVELAKSDYLILKEAYEVCSIEEDIVDMIMEKTGKNAKEVAMLMTDYAKRLSDENKLLKSNNESLEKKNKQLNESIQIFIKKIEEKDVENNEIKLLKEKINKDDISLEEKKNLFISLKKISVEFQKDRNIKKLLNLANQYVKKNPKGREWLDNKLSEINKEGGKNNSYGIKKLYQELKERNNKKEDQESKKEDEDNQENEEDGLTPSFIKKIFK